MSEPSVDDALADAPWNEEPSSAADVASGGFSGGDIIAGGLGLVGAGVEFGTAKQAQDASAEEAERNRQFQKSMSNTAFQRQVRDLKAAGLNPMLATGMSGSSTPGGSMASMAKANIQERFSALQLMRAQRREVQARTRLAHENAIGKGYGNDIDRIKSAAARQVGSMWDTGSAKQAAKRGWDGIWGAVDRVEKRRGEAGKYKFGYKPDKPRGSNVEPREQRDFGDWYGKPGNQGRRWSR